MKDKGSHLKWYGRLEAWFTRHRILATAPIAVLLIMLARPTLMLLVVGGALVVIGEISRIWASGYIDKNRELATAGPYAHTRNPLYVANLILLIGFCVMSGSLWAGILALAAFAIIYRPVIHDEAEYMAKLFGKDYQRWLEHVPLFSPRLTAAPGAVGEFSWSLVSKHREHKNVAVFLLGIALFCALYYWRR